MKKLIAVLLLAVTAVAAFFLIRFMTQKAPEVQFPAEVTESSVDYELTSGEVAVSVAFNSLAGVFSGELRADDIVAVLPFNEETGCYEWSEDLAGLRVLDVLTGPVKSGAEETSVQTVTLMANELQAELLATLSRSGGYHIVLMKRGKV